MIKRSERNETALQKMRKSKPLLILLSVGFVVMISSGIFAVYVFSMSETSSYLIDSSGTITFSDDFVIDEAFDTTNSSISDMKTISILNGNGLLSASFELVENITDVVDDCLNENDILISAEYNGTPLNNSDAIEISVGSSDLEITMFAERYSCEQSVEYVVTITTE